MTDSDPCIHLFEDLLGLQVAFILSCHPILARYNMKFASLLRLSCQLYRLPANITNP